jgi:hypothetical protein
MLASLLVICMVASLSILSGQLVSVLFNNVP